MCDIHVATYAPADGGGYLVTCPRGCPLGTSAHAVDEDAAKARVKLHQDATSVWVNRKVANTPVTSDPAWLGWARRSL